MTKNTKKQVDEYLPTLRSKIEFIQQIDKKVRHYHNNICQETYMKDVKSKKIVSICFQKLILEGLLSKIPNTRWGCNWEPKRYKVNDPQ